MRFLTPLVLASCGAFPLPNSTSELDEAARSLRTGPPARIALVAGKPADLEGEIKKALAENAHILLFPEGIGDLPEEDALAAKYNVWLVHGVSQFGAAASNARVTGPGFSAMYHKFGPGLAVDTPYGRFGVAICSEVGDWGKRLAELYPDVDFLLIPTNTDGVRAKTGFIYGEFPVGAFYPTDSISANLALWRAVYAQPGEAAPTYKHLFISDSILVGDDSTGHWDPTTETFTRNVRGKPRDVFAHCLGTVTEPWDFTLNDFCLHACRSASSQYLDGGVPLAALAGCKEFMHDFFDGLTENDLVAGHRDDYYVSYHDLP